LAQAPMGATGEAGEGAGEGAAAIDPVCGMTVIIAGAAHRAEHAGQSYYFCCRGCRARFLASPASFLAQEVAR
jgi:Cu+-exporting ATPase